MAEPEPKAAPRSSVTPSRKAASTPSAPAGRASSNAATPFERAKRNLLIACGAIGGGLAVAGTLDRTTGGVLVLVGWLAAIVALHRLGRTGSDRGSDPEVSDSKQAS
jgi:hypothetical protein